MTEQDKRAIKALCFPHDTEERRAYQCAEDIRRCAEDTRRLYMPSPWVRLDLAYLGTPPRRWGLETDALKETTRFQPAPICLNTVTAWYQGLLESKRRKPGRHDEWPDNSRSESRVRQAFR